MKNDLKKKLFDYTKRKKKLLRNLVHINYTFLVL